MQPNQPPSNQTPININQQDGRVPATTAAPILPVTAVANTPAQPAVRVSVITSAQQQIQVQIQQQAAAQQDIVAQAMEQAGIFIPPEPPPAASGLSLLADLAIVHQAQARIEAQAQARAMTTSLRSDRAPQPSARYAPYPMPPRPQLQPHLQPQPPASISAMLAQPVQRPAFAAPIRRTQAPIPHIDAATATELAQLGLCFLAQPIATIPIPSAFIGVNDQRISVMQLAPLPALKVAAKPARARANWLTKNEFDLLIDAVSHEIEPCARLRLLAVICYFAGSSGPTLEPHINVTAASIHRWVNIILDACQLDRAVAGAENQPAPLRAEKITAAIATLRAKDTYRLNEVAANTLNPPTTTTPQQLTQIQLSGLINLCAEYNMVLTEPHNPEQIITTNRPESIIIGPHRIPIERVAFKWGLKLGFRDMRIGGAWNMKPFHPNFGEEQLNQLIAKANAAQGMLRMRLMALVMLATGKTIPEISFILPSLSCNSLRTIRQTFCQHLAQDPGDIAAAADAMRVLRVRRQPRGVPATAARNNDVEDEVSDNDADGARDDNEQQ